MSKPKFNTCAGCTTISRCYAEGFCPTYVHPAVRAGRVVIAIMAVAAAPVVAAPSSHISPPGAVQRALGACFWNVPGKLEYVNLYSVHVVRVTDRNVLYLLTTTNTYGRQVDIELPTVADARRQIQSIESRLQECARGEP